MKPTQAIGVSYVILSEVENNKGALKIILTTIFLTKLKFLIFSL